MRDPSKKFEDLVVWRKAYQFVLAVYRLTHPSHAQKSMACLPNFAEQLYRCYEPTLVIEQVVNNKKLTCGLF